MNQIPIWVPLATSGVSALIGLLALWVATRAIRVNERIHRDRSQQEVDREARQTDAAIAARRGKLYETLVLTPVREYLGKFPEVTSEVLSAGLPRLEEVREGSRQAVNSAVKDIQDALGVALSNLKRPVDSGVDWSRDTTLQSGYRMIHHKLLDDVEKVVNGWAGSMLDQVLTEDAFRPAFAEYGTELLRLVVERDPELLYREQLREEPQTTGRENILPPTTLWPLRMPRGRKQAPPPLPSPAAQLPARPSPSAGPVAPATLHDRQQ
jgi:hypothetical protein